MNCSFTDCRKVPNRGPKAHLAPKVLASRAPEPEDVTGLDLNHGPGHPFQNKDRFPLIGIIEPNLRLLLERMNHGKGLDPQGDFSLPSRGYVPLVVKHRAGPIGIHLQNLQSSRSGIFNHQGMLQMPAFLDFAEIMGNFRQQHLRRARCRQPDMRPNSRKP